MLRSGDVVSYLDRCAPLGVNLQPGMNLELWKRDQGRCSKCGTKENLHFDHIIPCSEGGSSKDPKNIQILCTRHNLAKRDNIE